MKQNNRFSIVTIVLCLVILVCLFFPLLKIDLSSVMDDSLPFSEQLQGVSGFLGVSEKTMILTVNGKAVITTVIEGSQDLGSMGKELILFLRSLVLSLSVCALLLLILSFFRKKWAAILSLVLTAAGWIGTVLGLFWLLPSRLSSMIADQAGDNVSAIVTRITEGADARTVNVSEEAAVKTSEIRKLVLQGVRPALWVIIAVLVLLLIISILRMVMKDSANVHGTDTFSQPSFRCADGPLAGEIIPIGAKEVITFGSDPAYANMVISRSEIAPLHCGISYNQESGKYIVLVYENAPVLLNGKPLKIGENSVKRGSEIWLAVEDCSIQLL